MASPVQKFEAEVGAACKQWLEWDPDVRTRKEVEDLWKTAQQEAAAHAVGEVDSKQHPTLVQLGDMMLKRISFGTAGLRSRMAAGNANMNQLVIIQATQGLLEYMAEQIPDAKSKGVIIGYDGRHNSKDFAATAAAVFVSKGFKVHLFSRIVPTPMVPFALLKLHAAAGVMVTASHNPKDDNGYKVYWQNGAQIIPPVDSGIAAAINKNLKPWQKYQLEKSDLVYDPYDSVTEQYVKEAVAGYCNTPKDNADSKLNITYTAMHGVGKVMVERVFKAFSLKPFIPVKQQVEPDPDFPTVKFPNPEEGKGALALAIEAADANESPVILANDPDADRLAVAEKDPKTGQWVLFNGNQIAALFADWAWTWHKARHPNSDPAKCVMIASTVSSKFLKAMGDKEGFQFIDTLTGFKWMGNAAIDAEKKGLTFLFAYEVEIGFLVGNQSYDKDGVRMAAIFAELANSLYARGQTLNGHLQSLYDKYGYFEMNTSYFFCYKKETFDQIFNRVRTMNNGNYVDHIGKHKITSVRDIPRGYDSAYEDHKSRLPVMVDSYMVTFHFDNGCVATLRNSGTEPKLKYYVESRDSTAQKAKEKVDEMTKLLIEELLEPEKNGLVAAKRG